MKQLKFFYLLLITVTIFSCRKEDVSAPLENTQNEDLSGYTEIASINLGGLGAVEIDDVAVGVAAGSGEKTDARIFGACLAEHIQVQGGVVRLDGETTAAHGDDVAFSAAHARLPAAAAKLFVAARITQALQSMQ